ncbi:hypothetical protein IAD21_01609 [Abditibacteriota bacterium]|nr:hypothetical protein IAD21_01609 [Abditibacteriota bacterium]
MTRSQKRWSLSVSALFAVATLGAIFFVRWRQQFLPHVVQLLPTGPSGLDEAEAVSLSPDGRFVCIHSDIRIGGDIQSNIEVRELAFNRRVAFFANAGGGDFSSDGHFLIITHNSDAGSRKLANVELIEVENWQIRHRFAPPPTASFFPDVPECLYADWGKQVAVQFGNLGLETKARTVIWDIDSERIKRVTLASQELKPVIPESPIDSSCGGGVGLQYAKQWHAFLYDGRTGKILKDVRDPAPRAQRVQACTASGDEKTIAICYEDYIGLWEGSGKHWKLTERVSFQPGTVQLYGGVILLLSQHGEILLQNLSNNRLYWQRLK